MSLNMHEMILEILTRYGLQVLGAVAILVVGVLVARWLGRLADQRFQKTQMEPPMRTLLVRVIKVVVLIMTVLVALDKLDSRSLRSSRASGWPASARASLSRESSATWWRG